MHYSSINVMENMKTFPLASCERNDEFSLIDYIMLIFPKEFDDLF